MELEKLKRLGFSQTESAIFSTLLKRGSSPVQKIVEETGFYKANVYDALERMCERGLISKVVENNKRMYQLQKPEFLTEFIRKEKLEIEEKEKIIKEVVESINLSKQEQVSETASVLRGYTGIRQIYTEIVEKRINYLVFGSPKESEEIGEYYWKNIHAKQKAYGIKAKMIFHKSLRSWKKVIPKNLIELRFFEENLEPLTETTIYGDKVAFVVWTDKPVVTIIQNKHVAASYRQVFNLLWKISKP